EDDSHSLLVKTHFGLEKPVPEFYDSTLDRLKHFRVGQTLPTREVVGVKVKNQIGSKPTLLLHCRRVRHLILRRRAIHVSRHSTRQERLQFVLPRESELPLDDPCRPAPKPVLHAPKPKWW